MLGLFAAGLALQSLHLGHDIPVDEVAECECVATERSETAVAVLPDVDPGTSVEVASPPAVPVSVRNPSLCNGARAPPLA